MDFCHLHIHTNFSLLNGVCKIDELANKLEKMGQKAAAITDHGNMFGVINFYETLKKRGIKPIVGCEIYLNFEDGLERVKLNGDSVCHLTVLCENKVGYENLVKIVSNSYIEGFCVFPIVSFSFLKEHKEGLIFLSGCLKGELAKAILNGGLKQGLKVALKYEDVFGKGNFFLEIQNTGSKEEEILIKSLKEISKKTGLKLVATNNVHYVEKKDKFVKDVVSCIKNAEILKKDVVLKHGIGEQYLKSYDEMKEIFYDFEDALKNTVLIAERCEFAFKSKKINIPKFDCGGNKDSEQFLKEKAKEGLILNYGERPSKEVLERFFYELKIIVKMGFVDYFLIVYDYVRYAREKGIFVGPGRGSGAGSLIGFCLGITTVDPIRFNLSFERFLNPFRTKMPDFDIDFCNERRQEVIDYVIKKYGSDRVARIITFGRFAFRAAIRDVGRILNIPIEVLEKFIKLVPFRVGMTLKEAFETSSQFRENVLNNKKFNILFKIAKKIEGFPKNTSIHAAAVVVTQERLDCFIPLFKSFDVVMTQYAMEDIEKLNLLKMDFLGLRNLTIMDKCEKLIEKKEENFKISKIPLDDEKTFSMLSCGDSIGVFQLESKGMRAALKKIKPFCLEDLMATLSLNRPGPSQFIDSYAENRKNPEKIEYYNEKMKKILEETYGTIIYQEQVLQIFKSIAGYSMKNIENIRKAISKKDLEYMKKEEEFFVNGRQSDVSHLNCPGAVFLGVEEKIARKIFKDLLKFALYAFNKSHAAAYSIMVYKMAYLKCNFLVQFLVCLLNSVVDNKDKLKLYLKECEIKKIKILPININKSCEFFKMEGTNTIRMAFLAVKNVSRIFAETVVKERENGEFVSFEDFLIRILKNGEERDFSKTSILALVMNGAFSDFEDREEILKNFDGVLSRIRLKNREILGQISFFEGIDFKKTEEEQKILKLKGKIKKIAYKKINKRKIYLLVFFCNNKNVNVFVSNEKFLQFEEKLKSNKPVFLFVEKVKKSDGVFFVLKNLEFVKTLYVKAEFFRNIFGILKENEGDDNVLFYDFENKFLKNKNLSGVKITDQLCYLLKRKIGEKNFYIDNIDF